MLSASARHQGRNTASQVHPARSPCRWVGPRSVDWEVAALFSLAQFGSSRHSGRICRHCGLSHLQVRECARLRLFKRPANRIRKLSTHFSRLFVWLQASRPIYFWVETPCIVGLALAHSGGIPSQVKAIKGDQLSKYGESWRNHLTYKFTLIRAIFPWWDELNTKKKPFWVTITPESPLQPVIIIMWVQPKA